jgi:Phosphotransferase enzyme family
MSETTAATVKMPHQVDEVSVDWLNQVLGHQFGEIESIDIAHFGEGVGILGELGRITLTYASGQSGPATIVAKCQSPSPENQHLSEMMGFYLREVNFYRQVARGVDVRVPHPYYVDAAPSGMPFVLLIEDIVGASTPDQLAGISVEQAKQILTAIIPLHTQFWGTDELHALSWLPPMNNDLYKGGQALGEALYPSFVERYGKRVRDDMVATLRTAIDKYPAMLDHCVSIGTPTFTHTDCRAENYLFGGEQGDDFVTVIDFQLSTRHWGMWDVTNLIGGSMDPAQRAASESALVAWYVDQINAAGIDYTLEQATLEYRLCLLHQSVAVVMTSDLQGGNDRGTALLEQLQLRPILAAIDNDVHELVHRF